MVSPHLHYHLKRRLRPFFILGAEQTECFDQGRNTALAASPTTLAGPYLSQDH